MQDFESAADLHAEIADAPVTSRFSEVFSKNNEFKHHLEDRLHRLSDEAKSIREKLDAAKTATAKNYHRKKLSKVTTQIVKLLTAYNGLGYHDHHEH